MVMTHHERLASSGLWFIATVLCMCVMMQMLGVPVTLLHAADVSDTIAASVLEGFSVPPTLPQLVLSSESNPLTESDSLEYVMAFASMLFRPPVR